MNYVLNPAINSIASGATVTYKVYISTLETGNTTAYLNTTNIAATASMKKADFGDLTFAGDDNATEQGKWTWVADGEFPAININSDTGTLSAHTSDNQPTSTQ